MEKKKRRIKITDLPKDVKVSKEEMKTVVGGISIGEIPPPPVPTTPLPKGCYFLQCLPIKCAG